MFVKETLTHSQFNKSEFASHWQFLASITGQKWFKEAQDIVSIELGDLIKGEYYYLLPKSLARRVVKNSRTFVDGSIPQADVDMIVSDIAQHKKVSEEFKKARLEMRANSNHGKVDFDTSFEPYAEWCIQNVLMSVHKNSAPFLSTWESKRKQCKFTEQFLRAWLATMFLPMANHQLKVDSNDRADAEQLAFLTWADIMVSDDTKFMREAFHFLYAGSNKQFFTLSQFLFYLDPIK